MSQFCGSLVAFISRCGVTSAATAGMATVARLIDDTAASNIRRGMSSLRIRCDCGEFSHAVALENERRRLRCFDTHRKDTSMARAIRGLAQPIFQVMRRGLNAACWKP